METCCALFGGFKFKAPPPPPPPPPPKMTILLNQATKHSHSNSIPIFILHSHSQVEYRTIPKCFPSISAVLSGPKPANFSVINSGAGKLKVGVEVSGATTQAIFDKVFTTMVADAQPIPGFRRVKGGKTPDIPNHVPLEVLGRSKVLKQVIQRLINTAITDYVDKEGLKVTQDIRVEQSLEELESEFEAGEAFTFDVLLELQETN